MLRDRCPHRFVPLSMGKLDGDVVHCRYLGLGFDVSGACVHTPFLREPPANARATAARIVAKYKGLWFWLGDPEEADADLIPDFSFHEREGMALSRLEFEGNYELLTDNLMDLTHAEFLHADTFGLDGAMFEGNHSVTTDDDDGVWNKWDMEKVDPPSWAQEMLPVGAKVDHWLHMRWHAPASMALTIGLAKADTNQTDFVVPTMVNSHIVTPATQTRSHYFFDHEDTPEAEALMRQAFVEEDEPVIEAAQRSIGETDFWDAKPAIIATDAGAIAARRRLMKLRRDEASAKAQNAETR